MQKDYKCKDFYHFCTKRRKKNFIIFLGWYLFFCLINCETCLNVIVHVGTEGEEGHGGEGPGGRRGTRRKRIKKRRCTVMITKSQIFQTNQQTNWRTNQLDSTRIEVWEQWRVLWIHKAQDRKIAINGPMVQEKAVDDTEWVRSHRGQNPVFRSVHASLYEGLSVRWSVRQSVVCR